MCDGQSLALQPSGHAWQHTSVWKVETGCSQNKLSSNLGFWVQVRQQVEDNPKRYQHIQMCTYTYVGRHTLHVQKAKSFLCFFFFQCMPLFLQISLLILLCLRSQVWLVGLHFHNFKEPFPFLSAFLGGAQFVQRCVFSSHPLCNS